MPLEAIAGQLTHFETTGTGIRRAVMIHATLASSGSWAGVQASLLHKLRMTTFDRPGHGRSGGWTGPCEAAVLHEITTRIARALIDKRADLVGHSWGGTVALRLAMEAPEQVRRLILIEPPLLVAASAHPDFARHVGAMEEVRAAVEAGQGLEAARIFHEMVNPETAFSALPEPAQARMAARMKMVLCEAGVVTEDAAGLLSEGWLEGLTCPVLLIQGGASPALFHATMDVLAARMRDVTRVSIGGAGHMSPITHPEAVAAEIAAFLKV